LSVEEREKYRRFVFRKDRRDFAAAHALLRCALSTRKAVLPSSWTFTEAPRGKPMLSRDQMNCCFNLSHTTGLVVCGLSETAEIGIDAESINRGMDFEEIASSNFSQSEVQALTKLPAEQRRTRFTELWTLKEAYLKATGAGLSDPLSDVAFEMKGDSSLRFAASAGTAIGSWQFLLFAPSESYRVAVAVRHIGKIAYEMSEWRDGFCNSSLKPIRTTFDDAVEQ
jgi:4'-phosphopantetheinyl transferase